jgi:RsiW-degrading membrane proteinase PrsW (M82 family)
LITCALGFAALENSLFLWPSLSTGAVLEGVLTGNLRFIGSTLLHVTASGIIGIAMGFGFYKSKAKKHRYLIIGLILAIALHAAFNLSIINNINNNSFVATSSVWVLVVLILLVIEKIKRVRP